MAGPENDLQRPDLHTNALGAEQSDMLTGALLDVRAERNRLVDDYIAAHPGKPLGLRDVVRASQLTSHSRTSLKIREVASKLGIPTNRVNNFSTEDFKTVTLAYINNELMDIDVVYQGILDNPKPLYLLREVMDLFGRKAETDKKISREIRAAALGLGLDVPERSPIPALVVIRAAAKIKRFSNARSESRLTSRNQVIKERGKGLYTCTDIYTATGRKGNADTGFRRKVIKAAIELGYGNISLFSADQFRQIVAKINARTNPYPSVAEKAWNTTVRHRRSP